MKYFFFLKTEKIFLKIIKGEVARFKKPPIVMFVGYFGTGDLPIVGPRLQHGNTSCLGERKICFCPAAERTQKKPQNTASAVARYVVAPECRLRENTARTPLLRCGDVLMEPFHPPGLQLGA